MSRPLWGKARAEWAWWLAGDVLTEWPDAEGPDEPKWVAAVLWAAALDASMDRDQIRWAEVVHDITALTGVSDAGARHQFELLRHRNLTRPRHEPTWWRE